MKHLFCYCVYRIADFYKKTHWASDYIAQGYFLMFFAFTYYALALTECVLSLFNMRINNTVIVLFCIPTIVEVLLFKKLFPNGEKMFREYDTQYRKEKFRWLKGLLIFAFLVLSLVCFVMALIKYEL